MKCYKLRFQAAEISQIVMVHSYKNLLEIQQLLIAEMLKNKRPKNRKVKTKTPACEAQARRRTTRR